MKRHLSLKLHLFIHSLKVLGLTKLLFSRPYFLERLQIRLYMRVVQIVIAIVCAVLLSQCGGVKSNSESGEEKRE